MKLGKIIIIAASGVLCMTVLPSYAQSVNMWRGNDIKADWNDSYKWKLKHAPSKGEAVHFREDNSVITINSTVQLDNGMQLFGRDLSLEGNGNINFWSPVPHQRTVYIPASATGYSNLTLNDNLSINGRIALGAKSFGTSAGKGTITLTDRTTVEGKLSIGNNGSGSGKVFIRDEAVYRISELDINTIAEMGGAAEIHVLGGTAMIETQTDPFEVFLKDPSRKIILGKYGTLRIHSDLPGKKKQNMINKMIKEKRLVATGGYRLDAPVLQDGLVSVQAKHMDEPVKMDSLLAQVSKKSKNSESRQQVAKVETKQPAKKAPASLNDLVSSLNKKPAPAPQVAEVKEEVKTAEDPVVVAEAAPEQTTGSAVRLSGFIVFSCIFLLIVRRSDPTPKQPTQARNDSNSKFIDFEKAKKLLNDKLAKEKSNAA